MYPLTGLVVNKNVLNINFALLLIAVFIYMLQLIATLLAMRKKRHLRHHSPLVWYAKGLPLYLAAALLACVAYCFEVHVMYYSEEKPLKFITQWEPREKIWTLDYLLSAGGFSASFASSFILLHFIMAISKEMGIKDKILEQFRSVGNGIFVLPCFLLPALIFSSELRYFRCLSIVCFLASSIHLATLAGILLTVKLLMTKKSRAQNELIWHDPISRSMVLFPLVTATTTLGLALPYHCYQLVNFFQTMIDRDQFMRAPSIVWLIITLPYIGSLTLPALISSHYLKSFLHPKRNQIEEMVDGQNLSSQAITSAVTTSRLAAPSTLSPVAVQESGGGGRRREVNNNNDSVDKSKDTSNSFWILPYNSAEITSTSHDNPHWRIQGGAHAPPNTVELPPSYEENAGAPGVSGGVPVAGPHTPPPPSYDELYPNPN